MDWWTKLRLDNEEIHSDSPRMTQNAGAMPGSMDFNGCMLYSGLTGSVTGAGVGVNGTLLGGLFSRPWSDLARGDVKLLVLAIWVVIRVVTVVTISNWQMSHRKRCPGPDWPDLTLPSPANWYPPWSMLDLIGPLWDCYLSFRPSSSMWANGFGQLVGEAKQNAHLAAGMQNTHFKRL